MKLTEENLGLLILPEGKAEKLYTDADLSGFGARVRRDASGRVMRSWFLQYRDRTTGKQHRIRLGNIDPPAAVPASKARQRATALSVEIQLGNNPQRARKEAKKDHKRIFLDVALQYLADRQAGVVGKRPMRPSTHQSAKRHYETHWATFSRRPIAAITVDDVRAELRGIVERFGKVAAIRARSNLSALFTWAMREGVARSNPVIGTHIIAENPPRSRTLSDAEIRAVWAACEEGDFGRIIKLLLITGARRSEIGGLQWSELDLAHGIMTIPATRTKAGRELKLTLPPAALDILRSCPRKGDRQFLFGSRGLAYSRWGFAKMALDKRIAEAGHRLAPWGLHDLRRTAATRLAGLGVRPDIIELTLNHAGPKEGLGGVYNHYPYQAEIASALAAWARALTNIIEGANGGDVVPFVVRMA